ncbi:MAG: hypothetical protein QW193_05745 [Nitrososphaerales archaeon]
MLKTLKIKPETHKELTKIVGELQARNGEVKSFDDAILELIKLWKESKAKKA